MKRWKIPLHRSTIGKAEIAAVVKTMRAGQITMGENVRKFEEAWEKRLNRHCVMVNSGSSANLLMWAVLTSPLRDYKMTAGDEVIVPALCWSTTVWPIVQHKLIPVFVDITENLTMDKEKAMQAKTFKTAALVSLHLYGRPQHYPTSVPVVEDSCETDGLVTSPMASLSFYFSHHISSGEGGMLVCEDADDADLARIIRAHGWLRDVSKATRLRALTMTHTPDWMDDRFTFVHAGYNLRPTEMAAAIGLEQMKKLPKMSAQRVRAAKLIDPSREWHYTPFGIPFLCRSQEHRSEVLEKLRAKRIETRPILCGNMAEQPGMKYYQHRVESDEVARRVARCGFSVGCAGLTDSEAKWLGKTIREAMA